MGLIAITTSPSPITLIRAKQHLRIDDNAEDEQILALISAATDFLATETGQSLAATTTYRLSLDGFPADREISLPKPPLQSVESIKWVDPNGQEQTLDPATYIVDASTKPGRIVLKPNQNWPTTDRSANCVNIDFTAGYTALPFMLRQAILLLVGHWHEHREAAIDRRIDEVPIALRSIIDLHKFVACVA